MEFKISNQNGLEKIAWQLADKIKFGGTIILKGDLGVGKTTFARFIINALTYPKINEVLSPTFNLVHTYQSGIGKKIWHYDLYRIQKLEEVYELAIEDALRDICIIEWPEIIENQLNINAINVNMFFNDQQDSRLIKIS